MRIILGIDIGTSKIATVLIDADNKNVLDSASTPTDTDLDVEKGRHEQDVDAIFSALFDTVASLDAELRTQVNAIGVTGQMHGVLLWNGDKTSPLYTWKDQRASEGGFLQKINKLPGGETLRDGFGTTTVAWLADRGEINQWEHAATIHDYLVYRLTGLSKPVTDPTDAASWGCFSLNKMQWDIKCLESLGISEALYPQVVLSQQRAGNLTELYAGKLGVPEGIPISVAVGDNQASILATAKDTDHEIYLTIGTGAQLSLVIEKEAVKKYQWPDSVELRPFVDGKLLVVAAPLCGGQAFAWLVEFFRKWGDTFGLSGMSEDSLYRKLDDLGMDSINTTLKIKPNFLGERHAPNILGEINAITLDNFSPGDISAALARGIIENMYTMMPTREIFNDRTVVIGSGNAVRRLKIIQTMIESVFSLPLELAMGKEEAATGAALIARRL